MGLVSWKCETCKRTYTRDEMDNSERSCPDCKGKFWKCPKCAQSFTQEHPFCPDCNKVGGQEIKLYARHMHWCQVCKKAKVCPIVRGCNAPARVQACEECRVARIRDMKEGRPLHNTHSHYCNLCRTVWTDLTTVCQKPYNTNCRFCDGERERFVAEQRGLGGTGLQHTHNCSKCGLIWSHTVKCGDGSRMYCGPCDEQLASPKQQGLVRVRGSFTDYVRPEPSPPPPPPKLRWQEGRWA